MLHCRDLSERASDYLNGELSLWDLLQVRLHIFLCRHCHRYVEQLRMVVDALRLSKEDPLPSESGEEEAVRRLLRAVRKAESTAASGGKR